MKTIIKIGGPVLLFFVVLFVITALAGCHYGCKAEIDSSGLYNCKSDTCTGHCVLQVKKPGKDWQDIPGVT
jgi:hypothetical protein